MSDMLYHNVENYTKIFTNYFKFEISWAQIVMHWSFVQMKAMQYTSIVQILCIHYTSEDKLILSHFSGRGHSYQIQNIFASPLFLNSISVY